MEWLPIESAPKDGTTVEVLNEVTGPYLSAYKDGEWPMHGWGDMDGTWYPRPSWWRPTETARREG